MNILNIIENQTKPTMQCPQEWGMYEIYGQIRFEIKADILTSKKMQTNEFSKIINTFDARF